MATFCAAQVAATCIERINSRRLVPRSNRLKVFMTGFYAIVPGKIATDAAAEENSPTAGKKSFGAIEGTRTPTPLPVHGPEPCASANSATMAIWTCNAAAALRGRRVRQTNSSILQPHHRLSNHRLDPDAEARKPKLSYPRFAVISILAFSTFDTRQPFSAASA